MHFYLLASDEQTGDPEQLEAVCSYRGREEETVQSIHGQAQRLEREAELAVDLEEPTEQLTAGFSSHLWLARQRLPWVEKVLLRLSEVVAALAIFSEGLEI